MKSGAIAYCSDFNYSEKILLTFYFFFITEVNKKMADILRCLIGILSDLVKVLILIILVGFPR